MIKMKSYNLEVLLISFIMLSGFIFAGSPGTAVRSLPDTFVTGQSMSVSIDVVPLDGTTVWGVDEFFPSDWNASNVNCTIVSTGEHCKDNEFVLLKSSDIQWGILDSRERILTYNIIPSKNNGTFSGRFVDYTGKNYSEFVVSGNTQIGQRTINIAHVLSLIVGILIVIVIAIGIIVNR